MLPILRSDWRALARRTPPRTRFAPSKAIPDRRDIPMLSIASLSPTVRLMSEIPQ